METLLRG